MKLNIYDIMCWDSTDGKVADCGVGGPGFKSMLGMIFSTNNPNFVHCLFDSLQV